MMFQNHRVSIKAQKKMKASAFSQCTLLQEAEHVEPKLINSLHSHRHINSLPIISDPLTSFPSSISLGNNTQKGKQCELGKEVEKVWKSQTNLQGIEQKFVDSSEQVSEEESEKGSGNKITKGSWSKEEDEHLIRLVKQNGAKNWSSISRHLSGRIGKQCRERWHNHLNPEIKKHKWTQEEDRLIIEYHRKFGNKWALISRYLPGRTDNAIKNHWNSTICRKISQSKLPDDLMQDVAHNSNYFTPNKLRSDKEWNTDHTHHQYTPKLQLFGSGKKIGQHTYKQMNLRVIIPLFTEKTLGNISSCVPLDKINQILGLDRIE